MDSFLSILRTLLCGVSECPRDVPRVLRWSSSRSSSKKMLTSESGVGADPDESKLVVDGYASASRCFTLCPVPPIRSGLFIWITYDARGKGIAEYLRSEICRNVCNWSMCEGFTLDDGR